MDAPVLTDYQLSVDTGCTQEDLPGAIYDRDGSPGDSESFSFFNLL